MVSAALQLYMWRWPSEHQGRKEERETAGNVGILANTEFREVAEGFLSSDRRGIGRCLMMVWRAKVCFSSPQLSTPPIQTTLRFSTGVIQVLAAYPQLPPSRAIHSRQQHILRAPCPHTYRLLSPIFSNYRLHPRNRRTPGRARRCSSYHYPYPPSKPAHFPSYLYRSRPPSPPHQYEIASRRTSTRSRHEHSRVRHECIYHKVVLVTGAKAQHPTTTTTLPEGFVVVGGGGKANWTGNGNLRYGSYPTPDGKVASAPRRITLTTSHVPSRFGLLA
ncbi:hypothetical protein JAAARDRAFT_346526 [Jaapia argillacea MUCL 33604]|uniref:Uncharacterized protein n=1 Tax=Jaapia argillacea MUCL 33604 TaxID=933084 RepID=A0A067PK46_9AGAM|nr:hypothetical protein JAAARDRAFT_346526 [Jaapia argillacea MUCL 33604]